MADSYELYLENLVDVLRDKQQRLKGRIKGTEMALATYRQMLVLGRLPMERTDG